MSRFGLHFLSQQYLPGNISKPLYMRTSQWLVSKHLSHFEQWNMLALYMVFTLFLWKSDAFFTLHQRSFIPIESLWKKLCVNWLVEMHTPFHSLRLMLIKILCFSSHSYASQQPWLLLAFLNCAIKCSQHSSNCWRCANTINISTFHFCSW